MFSRASDLESACDSVSYSEGLVPMDCPMLMLLAYLCLWSSSKESALRGVEAAMLS